MTNRVSEEYKNIVISRLFRFVHSLLQPYFWKAAYVTRMQINRETGTIEFSLAGIVSADDILKGIELFNASSLDFELRGFVWDMRDADLSAYDYDGMRRVFGANPPDRQLGKLRIATVTSKFVDKRLLGLWEVVASQYDDNERQVFLSIKEARIWVSENPAKGHVRSRLA